eukprot:c14728_g1_i1.p1 GENE.c14728_g1_i1~~c14728_g1_i1.p1  ORF type:complete len:109 (-),score=36.18 c14728_g1_i1:77-403(-)
MGKKTKKMNGNQTTRLTGDVSLLFERSLEASTIYLSTITQKYSTAMDCEDNNRVNLEEENGESEELEKLQTSLTRLDASFDMLYAKIVRSKQQLHEKLTTLQQKKGLK